MEKKANLKEMSWRKRIGYIWTYYKIPILAVIIGMIVMISLVKHFVTNKETIAQILFVNSNAAVTEIKPDFSDYMEENDYNEAKQEIVINGTFLLNMDSKNGTDMYTYTALKTIISSGTVDILGADKAVYDDLAGAGAPADLTEFFSDKELEEMGEDVYYVRDAESGEEFAGGIILHKDSWVVKEGFYDEGCIIGIINGSENRDAAEQLLRYILE